MSMHDNPLDDEFLRIRVVLVVMLFALFMLGAFLWRIQVARSHRYEKDLTKQSVRRVRVPGTRGRIFDRNGVCMADNRPSYSVALYLEELRQPGKWSHTIDRVEQLVQQLGRTLALEPKITREDIRAHIQKRLPLPLLAWGNIDDQAMGRLAEQGETMPGVDIYAEPARSYPLGTLACHVLGYVGRADTVQDGDEPYHFYLPEMAGRSGLEKSLDESLRGEAGGRLVRVDVSGYRRNDIGQREPRAGEDLMLTLDTRIQRIAEDALGDIAGSVVILDPRNGDVLAMASKPGFDPNRFVPAIQSEDWAVLTGDERKPLMNRAVAGSYAPGSTFKPVTAMAGLESGKCDPRQHYDCPGFFALGSHIFRCWYHSGHGSVEMRKALEKSCNVFFFHTALTCGPDYISHMAVAMGLGQKTGIELDYETAGLVPDGGWKRRVYNDAWRDGDTCNFAIGQGALSVTPLQMAVLTSVLANSGTLFRPRLILGTRAAGQDQFELKAPVVMNQMNWTPSHIDLVRKGMHDVVMSDTGTGRHAAPGGLEFAGKTGTAEFGPKDARLRHAWMIVFAPFNQPRYAITMLVDEGVSGGETVAPRMRQLLGGLIALENPTRGQG